MLRKEAYQTILKVFKDREFSDTLLQQRAKRVVKAGENLALFYNLVKGVVKMKGHLDHIATHHTDPKKYADTDIKIKILLYIGLYQLKYLDSVPEYAAINQTVELAKETFNPTIADFVNAVLRSYQRNPEISYPDDPIERIALEHSYPVELVQNWVELWGMEDAEYLMLYFNENPTTHMRVNTTATTPQKLQNYFAKREIEIIPSGFGANMFYTHHADKVLDDVAFSEGYFSIQDSSAAMVVDYLDPQKDENILDLFAAPGGKCTYIAELMENTGEVVAVDKIPAKMKLLKQAASRLQLTNIKQVIADAFKYGPVMPVYDRVLVDAPCSGWGVIGRKADIRWQAQESVAELVALQEKALDMAAEFVKKDGFLIYSTCTMNPLENEMQIAKFLDKNTKFRLVPAHGKVPDECIKDGMYRSIPFRHNIDGAFAAKLQRIV